LAEASHEIAALPPTSFIELIRESTASLEETPYIGVFWEAVCASYLSSAYALLLGVQILSHRESTNLQSREGE
jgi:hypothetical protein